MVSKIEEAFKKTQELIFTTNNLRGLLQLAQFRYMVKGVVKQLPEADRETIFQEAKNLVVDLQKTLDELKALK